MDDKYTVAAIRRTWAVIAGRVFEGVKGNRLSAEEVRRYVREHIDDEASGSISKQTVWDTLSDEDRRRLLENAFPEGDYTRPEKQTVFISAPASMNTKGLRDTFRERGFDPITIGDIPADGQSLTELIGDCIDRANWVLVVFPHHGRNPNVLIELGYALAKKKRIIALVPPDGEVPLADIPYLRTELDNEEAIGFWLDLVLTAPKKGRSRKGHVKKTKPLGPKADDLLKEVRACRGRISEAIFMDIVRRAIEQSGVSTVVSKTEVVDTEVDLAVWSEDLEPLIENPIVIELKTRLRNKEQFDRANEQLSTALDSTGTQVGLLIYAEGRTPVDEDVMCDPRILVFSLEEFLGLLKQHGFADLVRRARNMRVHVLS